MTNDEALTLQPGDQVVFNEYVLSEDATIFGYGLNDPITVVRVEPNPLEPKVWCRFDREKPIRTLYSPPWQLDRWRAEHVDALLAAFTGGGA